MFFSKKDAADGNLVEYDIQIFRSETYEGKDFSGEIKIQLIGENRKTTKFHSLDYDITKRLNHGFKIKDNDVGLPLFVQFDVKSEGSEQWACEEVIVTYVREKVTFPIYDWIVNDMKVAKGAAFTHSQASPELKDVRKQETELAKGIYEWQPLPKEGEIGYGIPRYVKADKYKDLPNMMKMDPERFEDFMGGVSKAKANTLLGIADGIFTGFDSLNDFNKLYYDLKHDTDPPFLKRWHTDVEFGRQQIMGVTPFALKRCTSLPRGYNITDEDVRSVIEENSLTDEMRKGKIFIGDYSTAFKQVRRNKNGFGKQLYCPDAIGLFHVNSSHELVPIAIQLEPNGDIFTPKDTYHDWLLAKMYYRVAAANMHEWHYHFLLTHNVMEPFSVAMFRCLPRSHPLYKLLRPHLQTVSAINTRAREDLIAEGSSANKALAILGIALSRKGFETFKLDDLNIPKVIKERGLDDKKILSTFYCRDDSLALWRIINKFVTSILKIYYTSDNDVASDVELQDFAKDVALEGFGWQNKNDLKGMSTEITSLDQLVDLCTIIIFTSSAGHAAVNFPQFHIYQFIPNSPVAMRNPPHKRGEVDVKKILETLPDAVMSAAQIGITYALSNYVRDENFLGRYPMKLFTDADALAVIETFRADLAKYTEQVQERNKNAGDNAYEYLLPYNVPNSIAV